MDHSDKKSSITKAYKVMPILSFRKADILVLIFAVIFGVATPFMIRFALERQWGSTGESQIAVLTVAGEELWQIPILLEVKDEQLYSFEGDGYNIVVGYNGLSVWFESSDCPDQTCVRMGAISEPRQVAICVPNRAMLSITSHSAQETSDLHASLDDEPDIVVGRIGG